MMALPALDRPVFIVAAPRSGSTLLYEALSRVSSFWTLDGEAHLEFERVPGWHPRYHRYDSNRLTAADVDPGRRLALLHGFAARLMDRGRRRWLALQPAQRPPALRFLEKTPKNALRVPLIKALFPDARFVFLVREPRANVSSLMEAWRSGRFVTYRHLPGWTGLPWSMLLPPGWRALGGEPLERLAALQWRSANETAMDDLSQLPAADWIAVTYETLIAEPARGLELLCAFADIPCDVPLSSGDASLPLSRHTLTPPDPRKWRANLPAVTAVVPALEGTWQQLRAIARH